MNKLIHTQLNGKIPKIIVKVKTELYRKHLYISNGKKVLYVVLRKVLYGCLKSGLLFLHQLVLVLLNRGFQMSPYDTFIANKVIDGHQCTIDWHVDNLNVSHSTWKVVDDVIALLEKTYGMMKTTKNKILEYSGITINFSEEKKVHIKMVAFVEQLLTDAPEGMNRETNTPTNHFSV